LIDYDRAGNQIKDYYTQGSIAHFDRLFDAENRMVRSTTTGQLAEVDNYAYDGEGHRIKRNLNSAETWQVYGLSGELLAEYPANNDASVPTKEYGYRNGSLLITVDENTGGAAASESTSAESGQRPPGSRHPKRGLDECYGRDGHG